MAAYAMDPELRAAADAEALRRHREHAVRTGLTLDLREGTTAEAESDAMHAANAVSHQHHIAGLKHQREADGAARLRHDRERVRALQASLKKEHFSRLHAEVGVANADEMPRALEEAAEAVGVANEGAGERPSGLGLGLG